MLSPNHNGELSRSCCCIGLSHHYFSLLLPSFHIGQFANGILVTYVRRPKIRKLEGIIIGSTFSQALCNLPSRLLLNSHAASARLVSRIEGKKKVPRLFLHLKLINFGKPQAGHNARNVCSKEKKMDKARINHQDKALLTSIRWNQQIYNRTPHDFFFFFSHGSSAYLSYMFQFFQFGSR